MPLRGRRPQHQKRTFCDAEAIHAGRQVSKRVQAFRGATRGKANVDFDRLCFDCLDWRSDCDRNRSNLGSNFPPGQFACFLDVVLRRARVRMASCSALDRAEARQARKTRKLNLLSGQCPLWVMSRHMRRNNLCPLLPQ